MRVGDVVLKRSIYMGVVRWAFPHRVAGEQDGRIGPLPLPADWHVV